MKMSTILGGVASSAVIVAMAVVYMTADEAKAAVNPIDYLASEQLATPEKMLTLEPIIEPAGITVETSIRPMPRPSEHLPALVSRPDQLACLATNIYFEARGESRLGQEAVAWVTLNRLNNEDFPDTVCSVVWQDSQFSWTHDGKKDTPAADEQWTQAQAIAHRLVREYDPANDPTEGSVYFHADYVNPGWVDSFTRVVQIDQHIFYADRG